MIKQYHCRVGVETSGQNICAHKESFAKLLYYRERSKFDHSIRLIDIWAKEVPLETFPKSFAHTANYRGVPEARIGQRVKVQGKEGWILGSNSSANFNVLFFDDNDRPEVFNCHPNFEMELLSND